MPPTPWTADDDELLRRLHAEGLNVRECADRMGRGRTTVHRHALALGLRWGVSPRTMAATAAKVATARERRAALQLALLEDAERLRRQVWQPHEYIDHGGGSFAEVRWTQPEPSPVDKLKLMQAATIAIDRSLRLDLHDTEDSTAAALSMIERLASGIGVPDTRAQP